MNGTTKQKVVILGGGVGGITTAFALTAPELAGQYEVTLYQMGWRLGGKGASGRDAAASERIEEHGLHIWLGFYHNAFAQMKACYDELARAPDAPLATFEAAFRGQSVGTLFDVWKGASTPWVIPMPITSNPLTGGDHPSALGYVEMLLEWMARAARSPAFLAIVASDILEAIHHLIDRVVQVGQTLVHDALAAVRDLRRARRGHSEAHGAAVAAARAMQSSLHATLEHPWPSDEVRRLSQVIDLACAALIGLFEEGVVTRGVHFQALDDRELRQFLLQYGCHRESLRSPLLRGYYDLAFGFRRGEVGQRDEDSGAGTAIHAILRLCFEYRGAFMWRMQAGMGDTIFAPYYEVLRRRGVKFRFFHRVERLEVGVDPRTQNKRIERVHLARQVDVIGGDDAYAPLRDVKGLPSWPNQPDFGQIVQGEALQHGPHGRPYDLESRWSGWSDVGQVVLEPGDFDHLVLAIPVGAHRILCSELMEHSPRYREMVERVQTVQTFGVQLWLDRTIDDMGWKTPEVLGIPQPVVADAYTDPLNSFADNSHLIPIEAWQPPLVPQALLYFCGVLAEELPDGAFPPPADHEFPLRSADRVKRMTLDWLETSWGPILPRATRPGGAGIDWARLIDPEHRVGPARLDAQYWRANIDPSERYVLSVTDSTRARLPAGDSQFAKLALAGDWVDTGFCVGCVEAATMGGLQAARAITGGTQAIYGEHTIESAPPASAALPPYLPLPANLELSPPYRFDRLQIRSFPLRADPVRLQRLVDQLNIAPPEVCEFRAVGDLVYMQLAQYPYLAQETDPEGCFSENELSFNILVACGRRVAGVFVATSLAYYFPFIYVDNDWAIATGREVFGYHKTASKMRFGGEGAPELFSLRTLALPIERPTEKARMVELVEILETKHLEGWRRLASKAVGTVAEITDLVLGPGGLVREHSLGLDAGLFEAFARQKVGIVSLKQFRDAQAPERACYQAVVQTEFLIHQWHKLAALPGKYAVRIARDESMPILASLGLHVGDDGLVTSMQPFLMEYDCTLSTGTNLWVVGR